MENKKEIIDFIIHEKMKTKATLEQIRMLEMTDKKKSYQREIDICLDRMKDLDELYEKINNQ